LHNCVEGRERHESMLTGGSQFVNGIKVPK
jgi:hypothetical protein